MVAVKRLANKWQSGQHELIGLVLALKSNTPRGVGPLIFSGYRLGHLTKLIGQGYLKNKVLSELAPSFRSILIKSLFFPLGICASIFALLGYEVWSSSSYSLQLLKSQKITQNILSFRTSLSELQSAMRGFLIEGDTWFLLPTESCERDLRIAKENLSVLLADEPNSFEVFQRIISESESWLKSTKINIGLRKKKARGLPSDFNSLSGKLIKIRLGAEQILFNEKIRVSQIERRYLESQTTLLLIWVVCGSLMMVLLVFASRAHLFQLAAEFSVTQNEKERLLLDLRKSVQARDDFISIASHELKNPLTILKLQIDLMVRSKSSLPKDVEGELGEFQKQTNRLDKLVGHLFDFSQIRHEKFRLNLSPVNLTKLFKEACIFFQIDAIEKGVSFVFDAQENIQGNFDPIRLHQVLNNLLSNALKHGNSRPVQCWLTKRVNCKTAEIIVQDQGCGIPADLVPHVFERYRSLSDMKQSSGLGLGLYLCKAIIEAHNGKIEVQSNLGEGARFIVSLPID